MDQGSEGICDPTNDSEGSNEQMVDDDLPIPDVLSFLDVGYIKFDQTTQRAILSQSLRTEIIAHGSRNIRKLFQQASQILEKSRVAGQIVPISKGSKLNK